MRPACEEDSLSRAGIRLPGDAMSMGSSRLAPDAGVRQLRPSVPPARLKGD